MFLACGTWCLADVSSVSPSSEDLVHIYICLFFILLQFLSHKFLDKMKSDKSQTLSTSISIHSNFVNILKLNFGFILVFA